jgi:hypothetical protein
MLIEFLQANQSALLSAALMILIVAARLYFWFLEIQELRRYGHKQKSFFKKSKRNYKRATYADAA